MAYWRSLRPWVWSRPPLFGTSVSSSVKWGTVALSSQGCCERSENHVQSVPPRSFQCSWWSAWLPARPPPATHPPPPCLCSERGGSAAARDLPLICPFITLHTIRGSLEGCGDAGRWKTKRENKGTALRRPKGRCLLPLLPCWPGLGHPQAAGDLPHPCGPASDLM